MQATYSPFHFATTNKHKSPMADVKKPSLCYSRSSSSRPDAPPLRESQREGHEKFIRRWKETSHRICTRKG